MSKETSRAEHEYMNKHPPPPINVLATAVARRSMCKASTDQTFGQLEFMQVFNCSFK